MGKIVRQIRIEPKIEEAVQEIANREARTFSGTCNWLLGIAAGKYLKSNNDFRAIMAN